jgi:hypothetical protein
MTTIDDIDKMLDILDDVLLDGGVSIAAHRRQLLQRRQQLAMEQLAIVPTQNNTPLPAVAPRIKYKSRDVRCSMCKAAPGKPCVALSNRGGATPGEPMSGMHTQRIQAAKDLNGTSVDPAAHHDPE